MMRSRGNDDEAKRMPRRSYRSATRLATFAGRKVTLRATDFATARRRESLKDVQWQARGASKNGDSGGRATSARGSGDSQALVWRKPGVYEVRATLNGRLHVKDIVVGVDLEDLVKHPERYDDFFYCLVAKVDKKLYFLPMRPGARKPNTHDKRQAVLQQAAQNESGYRDFTGHQDETYACSILHNPHVEPGAFREGVYAVWDDRVQYLGTYKGLADELGALGGFLDHDANVTSPADAHPEDVFKQINQLFGSFDPMSLLGNGFDFGNPADLFGADAAGGWMAGNIGDMFGHFEDHLGGLGFDPMGGDGLGCMFGFNTGNATFSSRFSDDGMGMYRQSTNMLDPSGGGSGEGGMGISQMAMLSDGSSGGFGDWTGDAYWDETLQVLVLGASSPEEVRTIDVVGVNDDGEVVVIVNTPDPPDPAPGGETGGGNTGGGETAGTSGTSGTGGETAGTGGTGGETAGTGGTGGESGGSGETGGGSGDTGGDSGDTGGESGETGGGGEPTGEPEMPNPDDPNGGEGNGGGGRTWPRARHVPISRFPVGQRGCGLTDPAPDYDGTGGGGYGHWLGFVPPMGDQEWAGLVDPGPLVAMGAYDNANVPDLNYGGVGAGDPMGPGRGGLGEDGFMDWDNTCPDMPQRVNPQMAEQREMERLQGLLGRVGRGSAVQVDGMFSTARKFNCEGYSEKPKWDIRRDRGFLDRALKANAKVQYAKARDILRRAL